MEETQPSPPIVRFLSVQLPYLLPLLFVLIIASCARAQNVPPRLKTGYVPLDEKLAKLVTVDQNAISAVEAEALERAVFLDAREPKEYAVSHLPGALYLGYNDLDISVLGGVDKSRPVVVYCTVGYRSERAAKKLRAAGFTRVYNLYGSLYAWKLAGFLLEDQDGRPTERFHTYSRKWGGFVPDSIGQKVW